MYVSQNIAHMYVTLPKVAVQTVQGRHATNCRLHNIKQRRRNSWCLRHVQCNNVINIIYPSSLITFR